MRLQAAERGSSALETMWFVNVFFCGIEEGYMRAVTKFVALVVISFLFVACGSNARISKNLDDDLIVKQRKFNIGNIQCQISEVPEHFLSAIKGHLKTELQKRNIYTENNGDNPCAIEIAVSSYRMRSGFTRMMFGVFAGQDGIESVVSVVDPKTHNVLGKSNVSTFNVMAVGEMDDIARMPAEKIAEFVAGELKS